MVFYSPLAFVFMLAVPAIILLYLLKQKHEEHTVSSLYLWQEVLKDIEANAPWQKLKKNLLLFLQIAAMVLLVFALSRPFLKNVGGQAEHVVVLVDTSMSMQATDILPSRFESAKKQALSYVSNLQPGTFLTLVSVGGNAVIEENLSKDINVVTEKIKKLKVTNGTANLDEAASLVQSVVGQYPGTDVVFFGDQELNVPGVNIKFAGVSSSGSNFAVTLLSHTVSRNGITVLSRIANFGSTDADIPVSLYADGRVFDAKNVNVKAGETVNVYWNSIPDNTLLIQCSIDKKDLLDADNIAYDAVNPSKAGKVMLVSEKNIFMEKVLSLMNGIELFKTDFEGAEDLKGYELYIFDGYLPARLPQDGNLMVLNPPRNQFFSVEGEVENPVPDKTVHNLFKFIGDNAFAVGRSKTFAVPKWGEPVLKSGKDTLIFAGNLDKRRILVFGFDIHQTDMPLKPSFPILMSNAMEWLFPSNIKNVEAVYPGQGIDFNLNPKAELVRVIIPSGEIQNLAPPFPAAVFNKTDHLGHYILEQKTSEGTSQHYFSVNAPAEKESNLFFSKGKTGDAANTPASAVKRMETGFNLQGILLWLILAILFIEWWVYSNEV